MTTGHRVETQFLTTKPTPCRHSYALIYVALNLRSRPSRRSLGGGNPGRHLCRSHLRVARPEPNRDMHRPSQPQAELVDHAILEKDKSLTLVQRG